MIGFGMLAGATVVGLALAFLRPAPEVTTAMAQTPSGRERGKVLGLPRNTAFALLATAAFLCCVPMAMPSSHLIALCGDLGITPAKGAAMLTLLLVCAFASRQMWGWLSDRIGREMTYSMGIFCACVGVISLILLEKTGAIGFTYTFAVFFGMGWGATAPMFISTAADLFKGRVFGQIYGFIEGSIGFAGAMGPWMAGYIFDRTGSYYWAFIIILFAFVLSCVIIWRTAPRKVHPRIGIT